MLSYSRNNSTPHWDEPGRAPGPHTSSPVVVLQTALRCDQQGRCGLAGPDHWLSSFRVARHLQPHSGAWLPGEDASLPNWGLGSAAHGEKRGKVGESQVLHPYSQPPAGAPGLERGGGGDRKEETETSGRPGKDPPHSH